MRTEMNKELIERLAHEIEGEYLASPEPLALSWIAEQAIARYLAERGKAAVAEVTASKGLTYNGRSSLPAGTKLFLAPQPAIPEGMALVPIEPTKAMIRAGQKGITTTCAIAVYGAMIAAAGVAP